MTVNLPFFRGEAIISFPGNPENAEKIYYNIERGRVCQKHKISRVSLLCYQASLGPMTIGCTASIKSKNNKHIVISADEYTTGEIIVSFLPLEGFSARGNSI